MQALKHAHVFETHFYSSGSTKLGACAIYNALMLTSSQQWEPLIATYEKFAAGRHRSLEKLMRLSDKTLRPFQEPLRFKLMMQSVLSEAREEAYSAALNWSLHQLTLGQVADVLGICDLKFKGKRWQQSREFCCNAEVGVPEGHEGQVGRIDITINFQNDLVAAIEVKTRDYSEFNTAKHIGYSKWVASQASRVEAHMIFIAVTDMGTELHGFRFMNWLDVTAGLRKYAPYVIKNREYTIAATYLAFIGAVEQNLLGFGSPRDIGHDVAVRQADHLRTFLANIASRCL